MSKIKVKMLESVSGVADEHNGFAEDFSLRYGQELTIDASLAEKWAQGESPRCQILATSEVEEMASISDTEVNTEEEISNDGE